MGTQYKDFMIRWAFRATWTLREAAYILNEEDPETSQIRIDPESGDPVSILFYWMKKEQKNGYVGPVDETKPERFTPGDLIRLTQDRGKKHSEKMARLSAAVTTGKNSSRLLTEISWTVYEKAAHEIRRIYPTASKAEAVMALADLPKHFRFPNNNWLMPYTEETLKKKLRNFSDGKPGRRDKRDLKIDIGAIAKNIKL